MKSLVQYIIDESCVVDESIKRLSGKTGIIIFDIDDTLLKANPKSINVYKKEPGKVEKRLSTEEFAKDPDASDPDKRQWFDYRDFNDPIKVYDSIVSGTPIVKNLRILDDYINAGYDFCFLTARSCEDVVKSALEDFLKVRDDNGTLRKLQDEYKKGLSHAVNDKIRSYPGSSDAEKKANVLKDICNRYDNVVFVDDDDKNIKSARDLKIKNLKVIKANESLSEGLKITKDTEIDDLSIARAYGYFNDGKLSDDEDYIDANKNDMIGVAIISPDHKFVITKHNVKNKAMKFCYNGVAKPNLNIINATKTNSNVDAKNDFNGKKNTEEYLNVIRRGTVMFDAGETFGGDGYLPALGELKMVYDNIESINDILETGGGTKIGKEDTFWGSTLTKDNHWHWAFEMDKGISVLGGNGISYLVRGACQLSDLKHTMP